MHEAGQTEEDPDANSRPPAIDVPVGACDTHVQVYGPAERFPAAPGGGAEPEDRLPEAYRALQERLGTTRVVLVQPSHYGTDNRCLIEGLQTLRTAPGAWETDAARGIAVVAPDVTASELRDLTDAGVIGMRFLMRPTERSFDWDTADRLAGQIHDVGWDAELQMDGSDLHEVEVRLRDWPGQVVLEHLGMFMRSKDPNQPGFKALTRMIDRGRTWVKLSGPYESSDAGDIADPSVSDLARRLVEWAPERMVWGSNWPHPDRMDDPPNDADLMDLLSDWAPSVSVRERILVGNAAELYRFASP